MLKITPLTFLIGIISLIIWLIKQVISRKRTRCRYEEESALRGCSPAPTLHSTNLLGTSVLKESIKATKEDRGPQFVVHAMNRIGIHVHTLRVPVLHYEMLVTRDPRNVQAVFGWQNEDWDISPLRAQAFMPFLGEGIFTSVGPKWKHSRALVRPQFANEQISNLAMIEDHIQTLLGCLQTQRNGWTSKLDLQPLFFYFSIDVATELLYGQSVNCQAAMAGKIDSEGVDGKRFSENFNEAKHLVDKRGALQKFHFLMPMKRMNQVCGEIHAVVDRLIDERLATKTHMDEEKGRRFVLLDELAKLTNDRLELRRETLHTLMAGRDPTGSLLGWVFYFLARYPSVFNKLRDIVLSEFGTHGTDSMNPARLRKCSYLQWVMNESIRIPAVVPMNERTALRDTILPTGGGEDGTKPIFVLKGTQILIPAYALQHRPDIWGEDTETFRPERWEGRRPGWEWVPFGGGPRKCLGQQFALIEAGYTIVRLLQNFDKCENMEEGDGEIKLHTAIENRSGTGCQVRLRKAMDS